jgi:hypothetical protein
LFSWLTDPSMSSNSLFCGISTMTYPIGSNRSFDRRNYWLNSLDSGCDPNKTCAASPVYIQQCDFICLPRVMSLEVGFAYDQVEFNAAISSRSHFYLDGASPSSLVCDCTPMDTFEQTLTKTTHVIIHSESSRHIWTMESG